VKKSRRKSKREPLKQSAKIKEPTVGIPLGRGIKLLPLAIFSLTLAAFLPAIQNGFVNWDDAYMIYENPYYRGLGWTQISWMFATFHMGPLQGKQDEAAKHQEEALRILRSRSAAKSLS
jgi:hypothetical protein